MYIEAIIWLLISLDGQNMAVCLDYASLGKMKEAVVMAIQQSYSLHLIICFKCKHNSFS